MPKQQIKGMGNITAYMVHLESPIHLMKIINASVMCWCAMLAEPQQGWNVFDVTGYLYTTIKALKMKVFIYYRLITCPKSSLNVVELCHAK